MTATGAGAGHLPHQAPDDLVPLAELIQHTPGAHPITSIDELRNDAFTTGDELDEFLAPVTQSRHADLG